MQLFEFSKWLSKLVHELFNEMCAICVHIFCYARTYWPESNDKLVPYAHIFFIRSASDIAIFGEIFFSKYIEDGCLFQHGESELNLVGRIGGDADLSERGRQVRSFLKLIILFEEVSF